MMPAISVELKCESAEGMLVMCGGKMFACFGASGGFAV